MVLEQGWQHTMVAKLLTQDAHVEEQDSQRSFRDSISQNTLSIEKISQNKDFFLIKKTGFFVRKPGFILRYLSNNASDIFLAVSASKFAYRKAVGRNYAKRLLRELLRLNPPKKKGFYLLSATSSTHKIPFAQLQKDYQDALSKLPYKNH